MSFILSLYCGWFCAAHIISFVLQFVSVVGVPGFVIFLFVVRSIIVFGGVGVNVGVGLWVGV